MDLWVVSGFVAGIVPVSYLFVRYVLLTRWQGTVTGKALALLISVTFFSYLLSLAVLLWPDFIETTVGYWLRVVSRLAIAAALWGLVVIFTRAQRSGRVNGRMKERIKL